MIWKRLPQQVFIQFEVLQSEMYDAISKFNIGSGSACQMLQKTYINSRGHCLVRSGLADKESVVTVKETNVTSTENRNTRSIARTKKKEKKDQQKTVPVVNTDNLDAV